MVPMNCVGSLRRGCSGKYRCASWLRARWVAARASDPDVWHAHAAGAGEARDVLPAGGHARCPRVRTRAAEGAGRAEVAGDRDVCRGALQGRDRQDRDPRRRDRLPAGWQDLDVPRGGQDWLGASQGRPGGQLPRRGARDTASMESSRSQRRSPRRSAESPVSVDGRKLRTTGLWHFSWWRVLTEAVVQQRYHGISDPDQEWVLRELIHYLSSEASGAVGFEDMGENWVTVRKAAHDGTLRPGDAGALMSPNAGSSSPTTSRSAFLRSWERTVTSQRPRKQTTTARLDQIVKSLADSGEMHATLRIPDAVGPLQIRTDLRARQTVTSVAIDAPREGRAEGTLHLAHAPAQGRSGRPSRRSGVPKRPSHDHRVARRRRGTTRSRCTTRPTPSASRGRSCSRAPGRWARSAGAQKARSCGRPAPKRSSSTGTSCKT